MRSAEQRQARQVEAQPGTLAKVDTPNTPAPAVEARALTKKVKDGRERRTVLDALDLSVPRGELLFLRGPSGSGKTTLLALLGAMLSPTSGEVLLNGEPTSRLRDRHRAEVRRRAVGFVFQDVQLIDGMNALENVLVARVPDGIGPADRLRARTLLERFGVGALGGSSVRALSGGERQRVALARALLNDPPLLLLDEPTAHLDDARVDDVTALLAALAEEKRALVVATHDERLPSAFLAKGATYARSVTLASGRLSQGAVSARSTGSPAGSGATPDDAAP